MSTDMVTVEFDGDTLIAIKRGDEIWVVIKRVCEALGLAYNAQLIKLKACSWAGVAMIDIPSAGGAQRANCITVKRLPMWLATIELSRVSPDIRAKLERYQARAADALYERFVGKSSPSARSPLLADTLQPWSLTWQASLMAELCKLKGEVFTGRHPRWAAWINSVIYECVCGPDLYAQMRAENSKPQRGHNRHQQLTQEAKAHVELHLKIVQSHAAVASSLSELVETLRYLYEKQALQLALPLPDKRKKRGAGKSDKT